MNLLVLGILAFILLLVFRGYRKGFFKSAASAIGIVLAVLSYCYIISWRE